MSQSIDMRILMLAPQPFFEPRGTPFSVWGRLKALSTLGHEVDLVTYHVGQDVSIPGVVIHRTWKVPLIKSVKIGPSAPKLFLDLLLLVKSVRLLQKNRYDLLHTHEEASFFGMLLAKLFRVRHLYDMHSSLTQQLSNFRYSKFKPLINTFDWLERKVINSSDAIITICPALEAHVKQINCRVPEVMIENVTMEIDPAGLSEEEVYPVQARYPELAGRRIILYAGTFEAYQGLELLVASAQKVVQRHHDALFLMVGGSPGQVRHYEKQVATNGLSSHFLFTGNRPPTEVPIFVKLSHVLVSPRIDGTNTPLKIYSYLHAGKPIVATNLYTHTQVLNPSISMLVEPDEEPLAQGILSVLDDQTLAASLGVKARQYFASNYTYQTYLERTEYALQAAAYGRGTLALIGSETSESDPNR
jgi:glycosyltransferase involved in cell wall biosynthesis